MKNVKILLSMALVMGAAQLSLADDAQEQAKRDQLHAQVQGICPVSGAKLGEHGKPIKVTVGEAKEEIFLCCRGCLQQKIDAKHWGTIHTNFAKAQGVCPVMNKKLPASPKWTIVEGRIVYVCCPPCTKKVAADADKYLDKIDELYTASLQAEKAGR